MPKQNRIAELDRAIDALLARRAAPGRAARAASGAGGVAALAKLAAALREMPREDFRRRLQSELERSATMAATSAHAVTPQRPEATRTSATPALSFINAAAAIEFYKRAFGATENFRLTEPGGKLGHAEIRIGEAQIFLADEYPEYGFRSAETIGATPVKLNLSVPDVDAFVRRAVAEGARLIRPPKDEFYGERSGEIKDPFGYSWLVSTPIEHVTIEEVERRFNAFFEKPSAAADAAPHVNFIREGFHTVTPYLAVIEAEKLYDFVQQAFAAKGSYGGVGSAGGFHGEYRIGDSMLMIGGGLNFKGPEKIGALHLYLPDVDATYERALAAGATSLSPPADRPYGNREAGVRDASGNHWYIGRHIGEEFNPEGWPTVQPCLHPLRAEPVIRFLVNAFGAEELRRHATPQGVVQHAVIRIGTSTIEIGEAHGPYQPLPAMFYLYVPDADAAYTRALAAGATSVHEPADQPYGDRTAAVTDAFGNTWYVGTHIRDVHG